MGGHQGLRHQRQGATRVRQSPSRPPAARTPTRWCRSSSATVYVYVSSYSPERDLPGLPAAARHISIVKVPLQQPPSGRGRRPTPVPLPGRRQPRPPSNPASRRPPAATTSPPTRRRTSPPAPAWVTASCSTSRTRRRPRVIDRVRDNVNFAFWHSATFNNDGTKVVFTDELGGGGAADLQRGDRPQPGRGRHLRHRRQRRQPQAGLPQLLQDPADQADTENCVAHNGSLIPVRAATSWSRRGTRAASPSGTSPTRRSPSEIAYFERGPLLGRPARVGGSWSAYYYNGHIYSNDIQKGLDVLKLDDGPRWTAELTTLQRAQRADPAQLHRLT